MKVPLQMIVATTNDWASYDNYSGLVAIRATNFVADSAKTHLPAKMMIITLADAAAVKVPCSNPDYYNYFRGLNWSLWYYLEQVGLGKGFD